MTLRTKYISIIMVLIIVIMSGCKVNFGSKDEKKEDNNNYDVGADKGESSDAVKDDGKKATINKNDIDKIEVSFSEKEGNFRRSISIVPYEDNIRCAYSSIYLDNNKLECELDQENYDLICKSIKSYNDLNWKTDDIKKYQTERYNVDALGECKVKIDSKTYSLDETSTNKNLCQALVSQILNTVFPLKWKSQVNVDKEKYYKVSVCYYNRRGAEELHNYNIMNYVASPNYFETKDDLIQSLCPDFDKSKKSMEYISRTPNQNMIVSFSYLTGQEPLEYEFFNLLSKIDTQKIIENDEWDKIKKDSEEKPLEPMYKVAFIDKNEEKKAGRVKAETMEKLGQKNPFTDMVEWNEDVRHSFYIIYTGQENNQKHI